MTVMLALLTFFFFVGLDYVLHVRKAKQPAAEPALAPQPSVTPATVPQPVYVGGYELPDGLHYHRGHTWARLVSPDTAIVGVDDFARHLVGKVNRVKAPRVGSWMRQGAFGGTLRCASREADLIAPLESGETSLRLVHLPDGEICVAPVIQEPAVVGPRRSTSPQPVRWSPLLPERELQNMATEPHPARLAAPI